MAMPNMLKHWTARISGPRRQDAPALERAIRQSELIRIRVLIGVVALFLMTLAVRVAVTLDTDGFVAQIGVGFSIVAYECLVYRTASRAARENRSLPLGFWRLNGAIECLFPTIGMFDIAMSGQRRDDEANGN